MNISRLRSEVDKLKSSLPDEAPPSYSDLELACGLAGVLLLHQWRPTVAGARIGEILNSARARRDQCAGLI